MHKPRSRATYAYLSDWINAVRFLWHVFTARYRRRADRIAAPRTAFRDVTKFGKSCWYLPISMAPYFSS